MDELEHFFKCPYCLEEISMVLDLSVEGSQSHGRSAVVRPVLLTYEAEGRSYRVPGRAVLNVRANHVRTHVALALRNFHRAVFCW